MNRSRITGDLVSQNNIFVDIANDRVGIGSTIPTQKLDVTGTVKATTFVGDGSSLTGIANGNIASNAAIAGSKIDPDFSGQIVDCQRLQITHHTPVLKLIDNNNDSDFDVMNQNGVFKVYDRTNSVGRLHIASDGTTDIFQNLNVGAGLDVTGAITATTTGTFTQAVTCGGLISNSNVTVENDTPSVTLNDINSENDFRITNLNGTFILHDNDAGATRMSCTSAGQFTFATNVDFSSGIDVTGAITGTVSSANTTLLSFTANMGTNNNRMLTLTSPVTDSTAQPFSFNTANAYEFKVDTARTLFIHESGEIRLHHDGSTDAKLSTSSTGINISGNLDITDDLTIGGEFGMIGSSDHNKYFDARIGSSNKLIFRSASGGAGNLVSMLELGVGGSSLVGDFVIADSTDSSSAAGPEFTLNRNSSSPANADYLGQIKFAGRSSTGVQRNYAKITGKILDVTNGAEDGILEFAHIKAGSQVITGRFRSDSLQLLNGTNLSVNGTSTFEDDATFSGGAGAVTVGGGSDIRLTEQNNWTGNAYGKIQHHSNCLYFGGGSSTEYSFIFRYFNTDRIYIRNNGTIYPAGDSTSDLGKTGTRWANVYADYLVGDGSSISNVNATTLDSIDSGSFLRSDATDSASGSISFTNSYYEFGNSTGSVSNNGSWDARVNLAGANHARLSVQSVSEGIITTMYAHNGHTSGKVGTTSNHALSFITNNSVRANLTTAGSLDTTVQGTLWGASNDGSGSGLDADTVDGFQTSQSGGANKVAVFGSNGYLYADNWIRVGHGQGLYVNSGQHIFSGNNGSWKSWYNRSDDGSACGIGLQNSSGTDLAWVYANSTQAGFLNGGTETWRFRVEGSGITQLNSHGAQLVNGNVNQNLKYIAGANTSDIGISGYNSGGTWKFQLYGTTNYYGFLDANWGAWDLRKNINGQLQIRVGGTLYTAWHNGNDGSGSGLDADTLDGVQGSSFLRSDADDTMSEKLTFTQNGQTEFLKTPGNVTMHSVNSGDNALILRNLGQLRFEDGSNWNYNEWAGIKFVTSSDVMYIGGPASSQFTNNGGAANINVNFVGLNNNGLQKDGSQVWHAGNDGSGSGLDADTLDGLNSSSFCRTDTTFTFNASGNDINLDYDNVRNIVRIQKQGVEKFMLGAAGNEIKINTSNSGFLSFGTSLLPQNDNSVDLGSSSKRWANLYTADAHFNNIGTGGNDIDGTEGSWTLQEAEDNIYMINRKNGKRYKIKMEEV